MIRLKRDSKTGFVVADLSSDATNEEKTIAEKIAQRLNAAGKTYTSYKTLMEGLDKDLQTNNVNLSDYVDQNTITQIEDIYKGLTGFKAWDASQGKNLNDFDPTFYSKLAPETLDKWKEAQSNVSFAGQKIPDIDITQRYKDLNEYLHASYSFSGLPGKPKEISPYTEQTRQLTNDEYEILRTALLAREKDEEGKELPSVAEAAATSLVDIELENTFGALSTDALKQVLKEYENAKKQEQTFGLLRGMGLPTTNSLKEEIKNSILGDIGTGGFLSFGKAGEKDSSFEGQLDKVLGLGNSVQYNWQKWFDETLAKRYQEIETITDPDDASKEYKVAKDLSLIHI